MIRQIIKTATKRLKNTATSIFAPHQTAGHVEKCEDPLEGFCFHDWIISYFNRYPERWEDQNLFVLGEDFKRILAVGTGETEYQRHPDERSTSEFIVNGNWYIWRVGRICFVADRWTEEFLAHQHVLGKIKLVSIRPGDSVDTLCWEVCD